MYKDATQMEIHAVLQNAVEAFKQYRQTPLSDRAAFMRLIADELKRAGDDLIPVAMKETNLTHERLASELKRTEFQLQSYADFCESGQWLDARIDRADAVKVPAKPDLRKMLIPLGPVVVFGAANFPFAYSTAGGDTACALAAGCTVIVKGHPAHPETSELVAAAVHRAVRTSGMPAGVFSHLHGSSVGVGEMLVKHPFTKAVGFTGSFAGGKQLFEWGNEREIPIPVFAEMSSVNPVFLLPGKLEDSTDEIAGLLANSISQSVGQFCTNPGIIVGIDSPALTQFAKLLSKRLKTIPPAAMLNRGIHENFLRTREQVLSHKDVINYERPSNLMSQEMAANPGFAFTTASAFMANSSLQQEVFGPFSLMIICKDVSEMLAVAETMKGQLTATVMGRTEELRSNAVLLETIKNICGRFILNGVPTGVEVCLSMQHGGPFPATTDSRFTAVGADGIRRFARPMSFQNWPDELLPDELKEGIL